MIRVDVMFVYLAVIAAGAALLYIGHRIAPRVPRQYRRHSTGQIRQAIDHRFGIFGRSYPEEVIRREGVPQIGRNERCPCGSGKKYKRCHGLNG